MAGKGNRIKQKRISYKGKARILRKAHVWVYSTMPGPHSKETSAPIGVIIRDLLKFADNNREVRYILRNTDVYVNNRKVKDAHFPIGLFDIVEFKDMGKAYKVIFDNKGNIQMQELEKGYNLERISKIKNKAFLKKAKLQLNLDNGYNILVDNDNYKVKDSVVLDLKNYKIKDVLPFKEGAFVYITKGPHVGKKGVIKEIIRGSLGKKEQVVLNVNNEEVRTISDYVIVIPNEK